MPPPAMGRLEIGQKAQKKGRVQGATHPLTKVQNRVQKRKSKSNGGIQFSRFPAEIQHMIWSEAMQKPACHTFKFARPRRRPFDPVFPDKYKLELWVLPSHQDPSAYRRWKSMLWNRDYKLQLQESEKPVKKVTPSQNPNRRPRIERAKPEKPKLEGLDLVKHNLEKANLDDSDKPSIQKSTEAFSKLANVSFQAGFRRSMVDLQPLVVHTATGNWKAAAIDIATDLIILEFDRGETACVYSWFEHHDNGRMDMDCIRRKTRQLKRVAVHYKRSHPYCGNHSPFQCYCRTGSTLDCKRYKFCPMEQACFLDCFPNIEEFYYVVEVTKKKELAWCDQYRDHARRQGFKLKTSDNPKTAKLELSHSYDLKKEFLQLCPKAYVKFLPKELRTDPVLPLDAMGEPRDCLIKVMDIYKGKLNGQNGPEPFINSLEQRKKVKFGVMVSYNLPK